MLSTRFWTIVLYIGYIGVVLSAVLMLNLFLSDPTVRNGITLLLCYVVASCVGWCGGSAMSNKVLSR